MSEPEVFVYERRCDRCLFGPRPVFPPAVARQFRELAPRMTDTDLICHRATDRGRSVVCPGFVAAARQAGVDVFADRIPVATRLEAHDHWVDRTEAEATRAARAVEEGQCVYFESRMGETVIMHRLTVEDAARMR